jgi:hypothetical protein
MKITALRKQPPAAFNFKASHVFVGYNDISAWLFLSLTSKFEGGTIRANGESVVTGDNLSYLRLLAGNNNFVTISGGVG